MFEEEAEMLTKKAIVDKTITFKNEERVPIWVDGPSIGPSDVLTYDLSLPDPNDPRRSEWGFKRARAADGNWIVPKEGTLTAWDQVDAFRLPEHDFQRRFRSILAAAKVGGDRYRLASFGLSGYSIYSAIRGANLCYDDCLRDFDRFTEFFEKIVEFETSMFDTIARKGFHGVEFCDDWGPRSVSRITLSLWNVLFRKHYMAQIQHAKELGLHVWFSVTQNCYEFFNDLVDIGVDVLRVEDPEHMEVAAVGRRLRGKACFATRVDRLYDASSMDVTVEQIRNMRECLGLSTGGFIATVGADVPLETIKKIAEAVRLSNG